MARQDLISLRHTELRTLDSDAQHKEEENRFLNLQREEITRKIDLLPSANPGPGPDDRTATLAGDLLIPPRLLLIEAGS